MKLQCLIQQELLNNLMSKRFFVAVVMTVLLVVANTSVLITAYKEGLDDYSQRVSVNRKEVTEVPTYSLLALKVLRPPTPLSIFSAGLETRFGSEIDIGFDSVPTLSSSQKPLGLKNPYLKLFSQIDLVSVFQVVLSLLALIFAYDAIAGDWEAGTLRLVISHPVQRGTILFAKYIAAMLCLLLPVLLSLLMSLMLCDLSSSLRMESADFLRVGCIFLTTITYLSVFYLSGLLISTITRRASTSLIFSVFLWVFWVLIYPNWVSVTLKSVGDQRVERISVDRHIAQISEAADREEQRYLANSPLQGKPPRFRDIFGVVSWQHGDFPRIQGELKNPASPLVVHLLRFYEFSVTLRIQSAEKIGLIRQQLEAQTYLRQAQTEGRLLKISPASLYTQVTSAWASTDLGAMHDYVRSAQAYRHALIDAFEDQNAFGSLQWFATNQGPLDMSFLPHFVFKRSDIRESAQRALPGIFFLLLANLVLFTATILIFIKIEV
ncbi:MAG: ABC transporter permease subunit [Flavobacteriales bacterium]